MNKDFNYNKFWVDSFLKNSYGINKEQYLLFFFICFTKNMNNEVYIDKKNICNELSISERTLSRNLKELKEREFIIKYRDCYLINPFIIFKGNPNKRKIAIAKFNKQLEKKRVKNEFGK
jgi:hypothetical protein